MGFKRSCVRRDDEISVVPLTRNVFDLRLESNLRSDSGDFLLKKGDDVFRRFIAEELAEFLFVVGDSMGLDEGDEVGRSESRKRRFTEMRVLGDVVRRARAEICKVTAASSGDQNLSP
jgi:hypothetical protein